MKCILCPKCGDVRKLLDYPTVCACGASWGQYKDAVRAEYGGEAAPIFIDNNSLANAVHRWRAQDARTYGIRFTAGIAGKTSPTFKKVELLASGVYSVYVDDVEVYTGSIRR